MLYDYNSIKMKMVKTNIIQFDAVFSEDMTTYLYTHYIIDIQAVVNPATMSYTSGAGMGQIQEIPGASFPATTIKAIRHALLQPRKQLNIYDEMGHALLQSPAMGFNSDARNGPMPNGCHIINVSGART